MKAISDFWKRLGLSSVLAAGAALTIGMGIALAGDDAGDAPNRVSILGTGLSQNWAGQVVKGNAGTISKVSGEWTVPAVKCGKADTYSSTWVGIDGYANGTVEQVGTRQNCLNGAPLYGAFYEMYPAHLVPVNMPVKAGDVVQGSVEYVADRGEFVLSLTNATTGQSFSIYQAGSLARSSAEWVVETPSTSANNLLNLANFGTVQFRNASVTVNGQTGAIADSRWSHQAMTMLGKTGLGVALPSLLNGAGNGFSVTAINLL